MKKVTKVEIETEQSTAFPYSIDWQLIVNDECVAGGQGVTVEEATNRAHKVAQKWTPQEGTSVTLNSHEVKP